MEEKVILYTTHCPRCKALAMKLDQARIKYIDGNVYGTPVNKINISKTLSRNII